MTFNQLLIASFVVVVITLVAAVEFGAYFSLQSLPRHGQTYEEQYREYQYNNCLDDRDEVERKERCPQQSE